MALSEKRIDQSLSAASAASEEERARTSESDMMQKRPSTSRSLEEMLTRIARDIKIEQVAMDDLLTRLQKSVA